MTIQFEDFALSNYMYKNNKRNNQQEFSLQPASFSSEISLCGNIANANFRPREISRVRIFAMAKFRQDNGEISFDSRKIRERFDENS